MKVSTLNIPGGFVNFCDDVRYEVNGKQSYIGVYNAALLGKSFPMWLQQLCLCVVFRTELTTAGVVTFKVFVEPFSTQKQELISERVRHLEPVSKEELEAFTDGGAGQFQEIRSVITLSPLTISEPCLLRVRAYLDDVEYRLGSLIVELEDEDAPGRFESDPA